MNLQCLKTFVPARLGSSQPALRAESRAALSQRPAAALHFNRQIETQDLTSKKVTLPLTGTSW